MIGKGELDRVAKQLLGSVGLELLRCEELQALWAGYGFIYAVEAKPIELSDSDLSPQLPSGHCLEVDGRVRLVLKIISPPNTKSEEGHLRKLFSYEVEQYFYEVIAPSLPSGAAVAKCLASTRSLSPCASEGTTGVTATLMTDLRVQYPVLGEKRSYLSPKQVYSAIKWLAAFHGSSWTLQDKHTMNGLLSPPLTEFESRETINNLAPRSIWLNGGYTYLATRQSEYASLASESDSEWSVAFCSSHGTTSIAQKVANFLTPKGRPFESFIHGDVKSENLFSTELGDSVAFFDFQYVGLGLGVSDLAKLFTCSIPLHMIMDNTVLPNELTMQQGELGLLEQYHKLLIQHETEDRTEYNFLDLKRHWETALVDWCRFQASWGFWGNTGWLQSRVRSILSDDGWRKWLEGHQ